MQQEGRTRWNGRDKQKKDNEKRKRNVRKKQKREWYEKQGREVGRLKDEKVKCLC